MQADPLEAVFQKLSKEDEIILQLSRDKEKVESDNEKLKLKHSYELQLKTAEGNLELQAAKHELLLNTAKSGFELEKQQYEHEILNLKKELSIANWEYFKNLKLIKITTFLDLLDEKRLDSKTRDRRKRFEAFAEMNSKNLKEWNLTIDSFIDSFMKFSNKVCSPAHPFFDIGESLIIEEKHLEPYEFKLLGFLWEMFPLPPEKLQVKKLNNDLSKSFDLDESTIAEKLAIPTLAMSSHPPTKHYPFSRAATQNLLDVDSDDDGHVITDINPARFISNPSDSPSKHSNYEEPVLSRQSSTKVPSAGPSGRQAIARVKSSKPPEKHETMSSLSDSDESDEMGITKKKKVAIPGEYDPAHYEHLEVTEETKEIFQYIIKYIPQQLNLDFKFKPFIPDFIPAVGDIDAFLKIISPEKNLSGEVSSAAEPQLGLAVLDEPAANQSDPALLHLQLRAASISVSHSNQMMVVKKVDNVEKNTKTIDKWIKDVSELHRNKAAAVVRYSNPMPDVDDLMQEWPEKFENAIKLHSIPSSKFCGTLSQYVDALCAVFDIPVYKNKIQSLHVLFCLYAAIKNSQLYRAANAFEGKDTSDITSGSKPDHLVLE